MCNNPVKQTAILLSAYLSKGAIENGTAHEHVHAAFRLRVP
jgi:hypothetical protein